MMNSNETKTTVPFDATKVSTNEFYTLSMGYKDYIDRENVETRSEVGRVLILNRERYEEERMDSNELLKAYMEKVDRDQSDLRSDIRESERRTSAKIDNIERRMDERLNRIEDMISNSINKNNEKIEALESKIDGKTRWVVGTCIATIVGIAAMVVTVVTAIG